MAKSQAAGYRAARKIGGHQGGKYKPASHLVLVPGFELLHSTVIGQKLATCRAQIYHAPPEQQMLSRDHTFLTRILQRLGMIQVKLKIHSDKKAKADAICRDDFCRDSNSRTTVAEQSTCSPGTGACSC